MTTIVRRATKDDMPAIMRLMQDLAGLAVYMKVDGPRHTLEDGGFDENFAYFFAIIAEDSNKKDSNGSSTAVGCALCSYIYTWDGRSIHLDSLLVNESYRSKGIGRLIFKELITHAKSIGCGRIEFQVTESNPAQKFYQKLGAVNVTQKKGYVCYHMSKDVIYKADD